MASGNDVVKIVSVIQPAANYATQDTRLGGSTPGELVDVYDFDADAIEYLDFKCRLSDDYDGGGLTLKLLFSMTSATADEVVVSAAIRRMVLDGEDIDTSHSYDYNNSAATTVPSAAGEVVEATVTFTDGADMDSWAAGEYAIIRIRRVATDGGDDATGDLELWALHGQET